MAETFATDRLVWLVNEFSTAARAAAGEAQQPYPHPSHESHQLAGYSVADLVFVADALFPVFQAASEPARRRQLNGLLQQVQAVPQVDPETGAYVWRVAGTGRRRLLASAALSLLGLLSSGRQIGTCDAEDCVDVFVSEPRGRPRSFCSTTCQSRQKVRSFRRRALST